MPRFSNVSDQARSSALPRGIRAVAIDLDGTLVHTLGDFTVAINLMLREMSREALSGQDIEPMVGKGSEHLVASAVRLANERAGSTENIYAKALPVYFRHYESINGQHSTVYPGVIRCLETLRKMGVPTACLTNKPEAYAKQLLAQKGLVTFFDVVYGGDSFDRKKPDPLPLIKTAEYFGIATSRMLMVGDSGNDAAAANAAGCPIVLVTYGYNHGLPIRDVNASAYIYSLAELPALMAP